jgi:hypothetical protein
MPKLYMVLIGCTPKGRNTEQHDVFFGIADNLKDLVPDMLAFWPEAKGKIHLDAYREVTRVDGFKIEVVDEKSVDDEKHGLFFLNLGGYKPNVFDELHYKMLVVANQKAIAVQNAKQTVWYKHTGFKGATSHIDDKYGVDVDDVFEIKDVLPPSVKQQHFLKFTKCDDGFEDEISLGYFLLHKL